MKTIITLLGNLCRQQHSVNTDENKLWEQMHALSLNDGRSEAYNKATRSVVVSLRSNDSRNVICFDLPEPATSLVSIYDPQGHIISITQLRAYKNQEELSLPDYCGNYIVRVQLKYDLLHNVIATA